MGRKTFSDELRQRVRDSELSLGQLSEATGVAKETLSRFARGLRGMSLPSLDAVIAVLELRIVGPEDRRKQRGRPKRPRG